MSLSFQTQITPSHVKAATAGIFWRQALQPLVLSLLAVFGVGLELFLRALFPQAPLVLHLGLALLCCFSVGSVAWVAKHYYEGVALRNFRRFEGQSVRVRLDAAGYHYAAGWGQGSLPWSQFQSLWRFDQVWVLLQHARGGASVLLPAADLDDEARGFILAQVPAPVAALGKGR